MNDETLQQNMRANMAFDLLKKMMELDWKFDITIDTWDEAAAKRAVNLVDKLFTELKGEVANEKQH